MNQKESAPHRARVQDGECITTDFRVADDSTPTFKIPRRHCEICKDLFIPLRPSQQYCTTCLEWHAILTGIETTRRILQEVIQ